MVIFGILGEEVLEPISPIAPCRFRISANAGKEAAQRADGGNSGIFRGSVITVSRSLKAKAGHAVTTE